MISKASFFGSTNKDGLICSYYKKSWHTEETCFLKNGFPEWYLDRCKQIKTACTTCWDISRTQTHTNLRGSATCLLHGATGLY
jgi:hypothetical protein